MIQDPASSDSIPMANSENLPDHSEMFASPDPSDIAPSCAVPIAPNDSEYPESNEINDHSHRPENIRTRINMRIAEFREWIRSTSLSFHEKLSLLAMVTVILGAAALAIHYFNAKIPVKSPISKDLELPVEGERFTVTSVETFWRKPNTQGDNPDIVRRGIELAPVLRIHISGSKGAIRIFFRDSNGRMIGDSISRSVSGNKTEEWIATDGFTSLGDYASYRTGENPRWMIHVFEGPSVDAPFAQFKPLLETKMSADIRQKTQD
ncbi:MAG: hypothetical protein RL346_1163 [Verrucomicrobiota bacterium]|jgi:hypothetical protein